jgi:hypothetical protein
MDSCTIDNASYSFLFCPWPDGLSKKGKGAIFGLSTFQGKRKE